MRITTIQALVLGGLALSGCAIQDTPAVETDRDRAELSRALAGRVVAGPPQRCVDLRQVGGNRAAGRNAILFDQGSRIYVNRPVGSCAALRFGRTLVTRTLSSELCRNDIVQVVDPVTGTFQGSCALGDFTPYERVR